jgi:hypothetical protein
MWKHRQNARNLYAESGGTSQIERNRIDMNITLGVFDLFALLFLDRYT